MFKFLEKIIQSVFGKKKVVDPVVIDVPVIPDVPLEVAPVVPVTVTVVPSANVAIDPKSDVHVLIHIHKNDDGKEDTSKDK